MIYYTHEKTPRIKTNRVLKILFSICGGLFTALFLFGAIATSVISKSLAPALIILVPVIFTAALMVICIADMNKAYIEISEHGIKVVDYYFFFKKEHTVLINEIHKAEIVFGRSSRVKGYRYSFTGFTYIVFTDKNNKYLFKVINCPETKEYFNKYIKS